MCWLDRYRRLLALCTAVVLAPFLIAQIGDTLGTEWPSMHTTLLSAMLGLVAWWIIEVGLVYVTALWETEHERLVRADSLPRAILLRTR